MGKEWDASVPGPEYWKEVLRVLKPGGFLLCFAGTRTWHWMAVSIEKGGFEIRDTIMWLHGEGFPKSYNISKGIESKLTIGSANWNNFKKLKGKREEGNLGYQKLQAEQGYRSEDYTGKGNKFTLEPTTEEAEVWTGYGTQLKPAWEPIIVAMKPREGSFVDNALKYKVAGLNIDGCRIPTEEVLSAEYGQPSDSGIYNWNLENKKIEKTGKKNTEGRYPANVILDEVSSEMLDEQTGGVEKAGFIRNKTKGARPFNNDGKDTGYETTAKIEEKPAGKSRFFYCAKAKKKEKELGLEELDEKLFAQSGGAQSKLKAGETEYKDVDSLGFNVIKKRKNNHPTVKPVELMRYLCKLVKTPYNGIILDPFMGSGTTGIACKLEEIPFIGIEMNEEYFNIANKRIGYATKEE